MSAHAETRPTNEFTPECLAPPHEQVSAEASEPETAELPEDEMDDGDKDSAIGTIEASSTKSLTLSVCAWRTIKGRDYHSECWDTPYWLPIDGPQLYAQDLFHAANFALLDEHLHLAPLKKDIQRALDVGTGSGQWAIDFADQYPDTEVVGTDISPVQPEWVPPKLRFEIDDCTADWTWDDNYFDFVHLRGLTGSIKHWPDLFSQVYRHTKPGGLVESHEASFRIRSDYNNIEPEGALAEMGDIFEEAGNKTGCKFNVADNNTQRESMEEAGFAILKEKKLKMPIGKWPSDPNCKKAGNFAFNALHGDIEGYLLYFLTEIFKWKEVEIQVFLMKVRKELRKNSMHLYVAQTVVVGQKPSSESGLFDHSH